MTKNYPTATIMTDNELGHLTGLVNCMGTAEVPTTTEEVSEIAAHIVKNWADKPKTLHSLSARMQGVANRANWLKMDNGHGIVMARELIDEIDQQAYNSLRRDTVFQNTIMQMREYFDHPVRQIADLSNQDNVAATG